jgi:DegV family protein with EDD domain
VIRIVTDSSCDLPDDLLARHRVALVPLTIRFGEEDLVDREGLNVDDFWTRLGSGSDLPQTVAPSSSRYLEAYRRLSDEGADGIVVVCLSGKLSSTIQSASVAAEEFRGGIPIRIVDSGLVSAAMGLAVIEAAELANTGVGIDPVEDLARRACAASNLFATLDSLDFLQRGGRVGATQAFVGNLLDVKPLITLRDGEVASAGRVRTRRKALAAVVEHVAALGGAVKKLGIVHSDPAELEEFTASIHSVRDQIDLVVRVGPVIGAQVGPGLAGVVYRLA